MTETQTPTEDVFAALAQIWSMLLTPSSLIFIGVFLAASYLIHRLGWKTEHDWRSFQNRKSAQSLSAKDVKKLKRLGVSHDDTNDV
ncbi:hypothetical protein N9W89_09205 [Hellea sp.]|nr:hypothetical protein [Hellea sp.]